MCLVASSGHRRNSIKASFGLPVSGVVVTGASDFIVFCHSDWKCRTESCLCWAWPASLMYSFYSELFYTVCVSEGECVHAACQRETGALMSLSVISDAELWRAAGAAVKLCSASFELFEFLRCRWINWAHERLKAPAVWFSCLWIYCIKKLLWGGKNISRSWMSNKRNIWSSKKWMKTWI